MHAVIYIIHVFIFDKKKVYSIDCPEYSKQIVDLAQGYVDLLKSVISGSYMLILKMLMI